MPKKTEQELTQECLAKLLESAVDEAADAITWTDTEVAGKKTLTAEEAKEEFKKSLRLVLDNKKAYERTNAGFKLILEHIGEYPNDRLCLKELTNAANALRKNLEDALGPNLEKTSESLTADIDIRKLHKKLETTPIPTEDYPPPPSVAEQWNISQDTLNTFYQIGEKLYEESKIEEAISVFSFLSLLNGYSPEVWQSLAMCHHRAQEWIPAIQAYTTAIIVKPENPIPYLYSIDCYLTINDKASSEAALHMAKFFVNEENREQTAPLIAHYEKLIQEHP